jgi:hypothetical protein
MTVCEQWSRMTRGLKCPDVQFEFIEQHNNWHIRPLCPLIQVCIDTFELYAPLTHVISDTHDILHGQLLLSLKGFTKGLQREF